MKRTLAIVTCILLVASLAAVPTSAVSRKYNSPLSQYTSQDAVKGQAGTILYETFDSAKDANATGFFATYEEEVINKDKPGETEYRIPTCNVKISSEKAHSGKSSLKVYNRKAVNRTDNGEHTFICTNLYYKLDTQAYASQKFTDGNGKASKAYKFDYGKNIAKVDLGKKISANYKGDKASRDGKATYECETYYFKAWVYTDTKQTFLPILQYGFSGEIWIPNDDYFEVPAKKWTLVGGYVDAAGRLYYGSLLGDNVFYRDAEAENGTVGSGIYPPGDTTTYVQLKMTTKYKDPTKKDAAGNPIVHYTDGDFYVDDIAIWKVTDTNKLFNFNKKLNRLEDITGKPVSMPTTKTTKKTTKVATAKTKAPSTKTTKAPGGNTNKTTAPKTTKTNAQGQKVTVVTEVKQVDGKFNTTVDGTQTVVNISEEDLKPGVVTEVYINNKKADVSAYTYNPETGDITFVKAPAKDAKIAVNYYAAEGEMDVTGTGDKVLNFTTENDVRPDAIKSITVDGKEVSKKDYSYEASSGDATFKNAPAAGSTVHVAYYTNTVVEEEESVVEESEEESQGETTPTTASPVTNPTSTPVNTGDEPEEGFDWYLIIGAVIAFAAILFDILVIVAIAVFKKWTNSYNSYYDNYYNNYGGDASNANTDQGYMTDSNPYNQ